MTKKKVILTKKNFWCILGLKPLITKSRSLKTKDLLTNNPPRIRIIKIQVMIHEEIYLIGHPQEGNIPSKNIHPF